MYNADASAECYRPTPADNQDDDIRAKQSIWAITLIANIALPVAKIAILLQYLDFFIWPKYRYASWMLLVGVAFYGLMAVMASIMSCMPISSFWFMVDEPRCINFRAFTMVSAIWDMVTNILILSLPMSAVVRWAQPKAERWAFTGLYFLGILAVMASAMRIYGSHTKSLMTPLSDNVRTWLSTMAEINIIILCASLPPLSALIDRWFPGFLAGWNGSERRVSHSRAWMKLKGRDSPQLPMELRPPTAQSEQSRRPSAHSGTVASVPSEAPTMASVTTNNRGSAHPGALVVIPEDNEAAGKPLPSRTWLRSSRNT